MLGTKITKEAAERTPEVLKSGKSENGQKLFIGLLKGMKETEYKWIIMGKNIEILLKFPSKRIEPILIGKPLEAIDQETEAEKFPKGKKVYYFVMLLN